MYANDEEGRISEEEEVEREELGGSAGERPQVREVMRLVKVNWLFLTQPRSKEEGRAFTISLTCSQQHWDYREASSIAVAPFFSEPRIIVLFGTGYRPPETRRTTLHDHNNTNRAAVGFSLTRLEGRVKFKALGISCQCRIASACIPNSNPSPLNADGYTVSSRMLPALKY
ncbi:hypothetical protein O3P69_013258 [Scylla paramamosain]|uniref:Uncharacterized protein n=1 Tax=Scylla paramamosain TaxID=85552 RepID=A0AAW0TZ92_SCYPA